jgi:non-specific serine/threonine protein kinase
VVPASIIDNWRLEIERFAPELKVLIAHPSRIPSAQLKQMSTNQLDAQDAVISTYGTVMRCNWMKAYPWRNVILDEAQAIKNPGARQTQAVKALESKWRLALTGTPVENRLGDLWSIFDFLNPGLLGSARAFNGFCKSMASGNYGGYARLRQLVQPYVLRRLKTDKSVIADLPDKTEVNAYCLLSRRQAALYQQSVNEMRKAIEELEGIERRGVVLAFLMRFKQICNHPFQWRGGWGLRTRGQRQAGKPARALRVHCRAPGQADGVLPVPRDDRAAGRLSGRCLRPQRARASRRHAG